MMTQPLRGTNPSEHAVNALAESHPSRESPAKTPALSSTPPRSPQPNPAARLYKRRLLRVVHPLQVRMLSQVIAYSLMIFILLAVPVFKPLMQAIDNPTLPWQERATVANDLLNLHARFWPWALGATVVVFIHCLHSLWLMQHIAGPLYRLKQVFPQIGAGNLCLRTTLREGDYLTPEADLVNQMTAQLQTKITTLKHAQVMLALDTTRFTELAAMKNDPALTALAAQMEQNLTTLKTSLDTFKTHNG